MSAKSSRETKQLYKRVPLSDVINNNNITTMPLRATKKSSNKHNNASKNEEIVHNDQRTRRSRKQISSLPSKQLENASEERRPVKSPEKMKNLRIVLNNNLDNNCKVSVTAPHQTNSVNTKQSKFNRGISAEKLSPVNRRNEFLVKGAENQEKVITRSKKVVSSKGKLITTKKTALEPSQKLRSNSNNIVKNNSSVSSNDNPSDLKIVVSTDENKHNNVTEGTRCKNAAAHKTKMVITAEATNSLENSTKVLLTNRNINEKARNNDLVILNPRGKGAVAKNNANKKVSAEAFQNLLIPLEQYPLNTSETTWRESNVINCRHLSPKSRYDDNNERAEVPESPVVNMQSTLSENKNAIHEKYVACTPLVSRLRKCEKKNYVESSPESSICGVPITKLKEFEDPNLKVPVYKRILTKKVGTQKNDIYEFDDFDSDSENKRTKRNRNVSEYFDKSMHEILQQLEKNERKLPAKKKLVRKPINPKKGTKKKTEKPQSPKYKEKIDLVIGKVMDKLKKNKIVPNENLNKINVISNVLLSPSRSENYGYQWDRSDSPAFENGNDICDNVSTPPIENCHNVCDNIENVDNFFGFCDNSSSPKADRDSKVHVDKSGIPEMFTPRRCNANSTMLLNRNLPWRSVECKRNPHYILLKPNALPCLKQEPVIEHSFVEPLEERCSKINVTSDITKNQIQTSILDFVNTSDCNASQAEPNISLSLYDYEEFNENLVSKRRRILGVLQSNQFVSTPNKYIAVKVVSPDISLINSSDDAPFLGFDNSSDLDKENINIRKASCSKSVDHTLDNSKSFFGFGKSSIANVEHSQRQIIDKPFRPNVRFNNCVINKEIEAVNKADKELSIMSIVSNEDLEVDKADKDVQLFEDPEEEFDNVDMSITIPNIKYERKRRKRLNSYDSDCIEPEKPKKKKKDEMTKAEQAELDKWAQQFNAMCAEVEKYELDIE